ncbi:hypothetical protein CBPV_s2gp4 [Chronic bee paralysis virus]|uniref:hypothetical protein n=1 Tax=Chronic bee paralysis virus TaxID=180822 RepID=UPI0001750244|nr:hypothetical protein CBPV_s2gp4 [Chronic bee paralysis virus]
MCCLQQMLGHMALGPPPWRYFSNSEPSRIAFSSASLLSAFMSGLSRLNRQLLQHSKQPGEFKRDVHTTRRVRFSRPTYQGHAYSTPRLIHHNIHSASRLRRAQTNTNRQLQRIPHQESSTTISSLQHQRFETVPLLPTVTVETPVC